MIARKLTDLSVKALKPGATRYTKWDTLVPGFGVRVSAGGIKSFIVFARRRGGTHAIRLTLGRYPVVSLEDAREEARTALRHLAKGDDPREIERQRLQQEAKQRADTFAAVAEDFINRHVVVNLRRARATEALIRRELLGQERKKEQDETGKVIEEWVAGRDPRWRQKPISTIRRGDAIALLEEIADRRSRSTARKAFAAGSKLFNWAIQRDRYGLEQNPFALINFKDQFGAVDPRDRILSDDELYSVWHAAKGFGYPFGDLVRALMLNGQRLRETGAAEWPEFNIDKMMHVVPKERMKGKVAHTVPLTPAMVALLNGVPRFQEPKKKDDGRAPTTGPFVFSTTAGQRPVSGFSKMKARLDKAIAELRKKDGLPEMRPWVLHDLRRSVRTRLSELRVLPEIAERVLAHKPPKGGVRATYDLHGYDPEKREALEKWEAALLVIIQPKPGAPNVVPADEVARQRRRRRA